MEPFAAPFITNHRPLRIALVTPPWDDVAPIGYRGVDRVCAALAGRLHGYGHDVTVFGAGTHHDTAARFVSTMNALGYPELGEVLPQLLRQARVEELLAARTFDVVHEHTPVGALSAGNRAAPTVLTVHGSPLGDLGDFLVHAGRSASLVAVSEAQRDLRPDVPWTAIVHNGLEAAGAGRGTGPAGPVLWLDRLSPDTGPDLAIAACRAAGLPLVLAGSCDGPAEYEYLATVVRPLLNGEVDLILDPDRGHRDMLLAAARCLVVPNRWADPSGLVLLEAMAVGTPVVALRRGAVPELVGDGGTGYVCADVTELPAALHAAARLDPAVCTAHVRDVLSAELMARRYEKLYRRVLDRRGIDHKPVTRYDNRPWS